MTTDIGMSLAMHVINKAIKQKLPIMLWGAIPCTGGSAWQNYNKQFPNAAAKIRLHIKLFNKLFDNFMILARHIHTYGGIVVNEWPKGCAYWKYSKVINFFEEIEATSKEIHGCALGLKSIVYPDVCEKAMDPNEQL